ncbi:hypothetical protein LCGC14_1434820, partial [marine sediment metagenome]
VCSQEGLPALLVEINALIAKADAFNELAAQSRCARRVHIRAVPIRLEVDNELAAKEIARTVRETLRELIACLEAGDAKDIARVWLRCKNLERLAVGMHKFAIDDAKACAQNARKEIVRAAKENRCPVLDLEAIEAAIGLFVDLDAVSDGPFELEAVA